MVVTCVNQRGLDGLQDAEQGGAVTHVRGREQGRRLAGC